MLPKNILKQLTYRMPKLCYKKPLLKIKKYGRVFLHFILSKIILYLRLNPVKKEKQKYSIEFKN